MTREEQIMEYANSFEGKGVESDELKEIIRLAIIDGAKWADAHPKEPSLPTNLDEAAEEYGNKYLQDCKGCNGTPIKTAFKAGAEWMAGQGETRDDITVTGDFDNKAHIFPIPSSKFNPGDKVVVQIRKK